MKKSLKKLIIAVVVLALLASIAVVVVFTGFNNYKYMTYSSSRKSANYAAFDEAYANGKVKFIAHRGLSVEAYQNSKEAFDLAAADPDAFGIETDVWLTKDKKAVCMHDKNSLVGIPDISKVSFEKAITTPVKKNKNVYPCPFEDYLAACKAGDKTAIVEFKDGRMTNDDIDIVLAAVKQAGVKVMYASFNFSILSYIRSLDDEVGLFLFTFVGLPVSVEGGSVKTKMQKLIDIRCNLSFNYNFLNKSLVDRFHSAGLEVGIWTVNNSLAVASAVSELGVDYITTDLRKTALFA